MTKWHTCYRSGFYAPFIRIVSEYSIFRELSIRLCYIKPSLLSECMTNGLFVKKKQIKSICWDQLLKFVIKIVSESKHIRSRATICWDRYRKVSRSTSSIDLLWTFDLLRSTVSISADRGKRRRKTTNSSSIFTRNFTDILTYNTAFLFDNNCVYFDFNTHSFTPVFLNFWEIRQRSS